MIYLREERLKDEVVDFVSELKLHARLSKNKPLEKGHSLYEKGAELKFWTRRTKAIYIKTYRSKLSGKLIHVVRNARKNILQLTEKGEE